MPSEMYRLAAFDLKNAKWNMTQADDIAPRFAAYHVQQCVEKTLKQALRLYGVNYTKTHAILELVDMLPDTQEIFSQSVLDLIELRGSRLTDWSAKSRYAEGYMVKRSTVEQAIELAELALSELQTYESALPTLPDNVYDTSSGFGTAVPDILLE